MSYFINGTFTCESDAKISVLDLGLLRGFSIFEYIRTYRKQPFHLIDHLQRLRYSANQLNLVLPYTFEEFTTIIHTLLKNPVLEAAECGIKILVTGGVSQDQLIPTQPSSCILFAYPHTPYPTPLYEEGIAVASTLLQRSLPHCKTTQYIPAIVALQSAAGAKEALYVTAQGEILEATTSNFFAIKQGQLYTSTSPHLLQGITRELVLKMAKEHHFAISSEPIFLSDIVAYDEAFVTATNKEILPVVAIDNRPIGNGQVGPQTRQIATLFRAYTQQDHWPSLEISRHQTV